MKKTIILSVALAFVLVALVAFTGNSPPAGSSAENCMVMANTSAAQLPTASVVVVEQISLAQMRVVANPVIDASAGIVPYARVEEFNRPTLTGRVALNFKNDNGGVRHQADPRPFTYPTRV